MDNADKQDFKETFDGLSEYYQQKAKLTPMALRMYWAGLEDYTLDQVQTAATLHMRDSNGGQFYPKVADFVKQIEGGAITPDMVVSAAKLAKTPFGVMCAMHIGSWDLRSADAFQLRQQAQECLDLLPEWKAKASEGAYTQREIEVLAKYGVNPIQPFREGLPAPVMNHPLEAKYYLALSKESEVLQIEAPTLSGTEGQQVVASIIAGLAVSVVPDYRTNLIPCECCKVPFEEILNICPNPVCGIERCGEKR
jgi:hypothetical protein